MRFTTGSRQGDCKEQLLRGFHHQLPLVLLCIFGSSFAFVVVPTRRGEYILNSVQDDNLLGFPNRLKGHELLDAASAATKKSCSFLGVKSVGVDYGLVRTGIAATVGYTPKPVAILSDLNRTQVCEEIIQICKAEEAERLIVGLPLHKNGTEANQTQLTREFAQQLAIVALEHLGPSVPLYLFDERYTSKEAAARAYTRDPGCNVYGTLDAEAACIILENYYNDNARDAELVALPDELAKKYIETWKEREKSRKKALQIAQEEREVRLSWKKEAMARDREQDLLRSSSVTVTTKKGKKKRKNKKM